MTTNNMSIFNTSMFNKYNNIYYTTTIALKQLINKSNTIHFRMRRICPIQHMASRMFPLHHTGGNSWS